jgi:chloramphenicol O-acetyltransferase type A
MHIIDQARWPRRAHFLYYTSVEQPYLEVTSRIPLGPLWSIARAQRRSIFAACLWTLTNAANHVPELRQRIRDQGACVVQHDLVHPKWTALAADDTVRFCRGRFESPEALEAQTRSFAQQAQDLDLEPHDPSDDVLYLSCLPWLDFTGIHQPLPGRSSGDCIPRIVWGRLVERPDGHHEIAASIGAHHALVDGLHVARFFEAAAASAAELCDRWR